jgi:hypothetical protein
MTVAPKAWMVQLAPDAEWVMVLVVDVMILFVGSLYLIIEWIFFSIFNVTLFLDAFRRSTEI